MKFIKLNKDGINGEMIFLNPAVIVGLEPETDYLTYIKTVFEEGFWAKGSVKEILQLIKEAEEI